MAKRKKPENETEEQAKVRKILESIANHAERSEKTAWKRKNDNMQKLLDQLRPVEQKILDIIIDEKQPILDKIAELRNTMVKECIHPFDMLVMKDDGYVECKFCGRKLKVPDGDEKDV